MAARKRNYWPSLPPTPIPLSDQDWKIASVGTSAKQHTKRGGGGGEGRRKYERRPFVLKAQLSIVPEWKRRPTESTAPPARCRRGRK